MDDITTRLVGCFQIVFPEIPVASIPKASQDSVAAWDSVAGVNLVQVIEEEFGLQLDYAQLERLNSFKVIESHLREIVK